MSSSINLNRVFSGATYLTLASVVGRLLSILSFPILTRLLPPETYGVAALATTIISIFTIVGLFGQDTSYVFSYNDVDGLEREQVDQFYWRYSFIAGALLGLAGALAWSVSASILHTATSPWVGLFVLIGVAGSIVSTFAQVRARLLDRYETLAFALLVSGVISTAVCITIAWLWRRDEIALMAAVTSYWVVVAMLPTLGLRELLRPTQLSKAQVRRMVAIGLPLIVNAPAYWIISSADRWFLAAHASKAELGVYAAGVTVASLGIMVTSALGTVWTPELLRHVRDGEITNKDQLARALTVVIWLIVTTCFVIVMFGDVMIRILAGPAFQGAAAYVPLIALACMFYGINQLIGFGIVLRRKSKVFPLIWLAGVAVSLFLNATLVPRFGGTGAALTQCLTFGVVVAVTWCVGRPYTPFQPIWRSLFAAAALYFAALALLQVPPLQSSLLAAIALRSVLALFTIGLAMLIVLRSIGPLDNVMAPWLRRVLAKEVRHEP